MSVTPMLLCGDCGSQFEPDLSVFSSPSAQGGTGAEKSDAPPNSGLDLSRAYKELERFKLIIAERERSISKLKYDMALLERRISEQVTRSGALSSLPVELLCRIFTLVCTPEADQHPVPHPWVSNPMALAHVKDVSCGLRKALFLPACRLASVCKRWREIAVGLSSLWCNVVVSLEADFPEYERTSFLLHHFAKRCKLGDVNLFIILPLKRYDTYREEPIGDMFGTFLKQFRRRIVSIRVFGNHDPLAHVFSLNDNDDDDEDVDLSQYFPRLSVFGFLDATPNHFYHSPILPGDEAFEWLQPSSRLTHLQIHATTFPCSLHDALSGSKQITHMTLNGLYANYCQLLGQLLNCSNLTVVIGQEEPNMGLSGMITLPQIRNLSIQVDNVSPSHDPHWRWYWSLQILFKNWRLVGLESLHIKAVPGANPARQEPLEWHSVEFNEFALRSDLSDTLRSFELQDVALTSSASLASSLKLLPSLTSLSLSLWTENPDWDDDDDSSEECGHTSDPQPSQILLFVRSLMVPSEPAPNEVETTTPLLPNLTHLALTLSLSEDRLLERLATVHGMAEGRLENDGRVVRLRQLSFSIVPGEMKGDPLVEEGLTRVRSLGAKGLDVSIDVLSMDHLFD